jgi:phage baseplate assembly protein W
MANKIYYKGFSSDQWLTDAQKSFATANIQTVKNDLYNHIFTEKGERVMMPNFGTRIPSLVFEQNDAATLQIVREDLTEVFNYDPRVRLINLEVVPLMDNNAIVAFADLLYVEFNVQDVLQIEIQTA